MALSSEGLRFYLLTNLQISFMAGGNRQVTSGSETKDLLLLAHQEA